MPCRRTESTNGRGEPRLLAAYVDDARLDEAHRRGMVGVELLDVVGVRAHPIGGRQPFAHGTFNGFVFEAGFDFRHGGWLE